MVDRARSKTTGATGGSGGDVIITPPGDSDGTISTGSQTESMGVSAATSRSMGSETDSFDFTPKPLLSQGSETDTFAATLTSTATTSQGSDTSTMNQMNAAAGPITHGNETDSFLADASAFVQQFTATATVTNNQAGPPTWSNPTNAQGDFDGTVSVILHNGSGVPPPSTANAYLRCNLPAINSTPPGFTRSGVFIRIVHDWDLVINGAVPGVLDVTMVLEVWNSTNTTLLQTLFTKRASASGGEQTTLLTEDFLLTAVSDTDLNNGLSIRCHFFTTGAVVPATNGSSDWRVDGVHLRTNYTRTGIT